MMELIKAVIFGIVQGITEWLPISSTGHLLLVDELIALKVFDDVAMNTSFVNMFMVVIQFGSILAVCLLYYQKLNPFLKTKSPTERKETLNLWGKVLIGIIPAGIAGILLDDLIDSYFHGPIVIAVMLIVYGILFIVVENQKRRASIRSFDQMSWKTALAIGCFQALALIPGTSRSGATIIGAVILGTSRTVAAEFSFFLAVPVMAGASLLKIIKMNVVMNTLAWATLLIGTFVSFIVSVLAIRFLMDYIRKHNFKAFGVYRIILGILVLLTVFL